MTKKQNNNWIERFDKFIRKIEHFDIRSRDEVLDYIRSERLKWNKEMRDMIGEDEGEKKELNNIDKAFGVTGLTVVNDKQMIRNQFRHQLLEQLSIKEKK